MPERSEIARKFKANYLISIHADSSKSPDRRGASVWVLSNRRANDEMGQWLEDDEKRSELLGGAGKVLSHNNDKYLDQTVLDLQFGHSQRTGYVLGEHILHHFAKVTTLSRSTPQHASLGVLRSHRYSFCVGRNWISFQFRRRKNLIPKLIVAALLI